MSCNFSHRFFVTVVIYVIFRVYVAKKITLTLRDFGNLSLKGKKDESLLPVDNHGVLLRQDIYCFKYVGLWGHTFGKNTYMGESSTHR